jgi:hypothetical protein
VRRRIALISCTALLAIAPGTAQAGGSPVSAADRASETAQARAAACNTVRYGGRTYVLYRRGGVRCLFARRWVRRLHNSGGMNKPPGWRCTSGSGYRRGGNCTRGRRAFGWHPGD